jgi:alcohol dehydrogenase class IV
MDFKFILPGRIIFGPGSIKQIGRLMKELGGNNVLIVASKGMLERRCLGQVKESLEANQLGYVIFSGVEPEPPESNVTECVRFSRKNGCDAVIGLGGGSVLDVAKMVAAELGLPKIMAPTNAGTGSEVTHESVFKFDKRKRAVVREDLTPDAAVIDPELTKTAPRALTARVGIDALAHAVECYQSKTSNPLVRTIAFAAIQLLHENLPGALKGNDEALQNMALGSLMSGMAFGNSGTTLAHALSYPFSNRGVPHGDAVAMVLPYAVEFNGVDIVSSSKLKDIAGVIKTRWDPNWDIEEMAEEVMVDEKHLNNNPRPVSYGDVVHIFQTMKEAFSKRRIPCKQ